jgi:hypothetical protein
MLVRLRRWAAVAVGLGAAAPRRHLMPAASTVCAVDVDRRCASSCAAAQTRGTGPADAPGLGWPVGVPSYRVDDDAITLGRFGMDAAAHAYTYIHAYTYEAIARYCNSQAAMPSAVCGNAANDDRRAPYVAVVRCFGRCTFCARSARRVSAGDRCALPQPSRRRAQALAEAAPPRGPRAAVITRSQRTPSPVRCTTALRPPPHCHQPAMPRSLRFVVAPLRSAPFRWR